MGWNWMDVTVAASADNSYPSSPDISAYAFAAQSTQHVIYTASENGHIHELWWNNAGWHFNDLTIAANSAPSSGSASLLSTAYVFDAQGTQHVFYIGGEDFHIHELWWDKNRWHHHDLTDATGIPSGLGLGSGDPELAAYVFAAQGTQHVNYRRNDGHVIELWWDSNGWHFNDLTIAASATDLPNSAVNGYAFNAQGTQHVIYRDNDCHIIELWWDSNGWHHNDLTVAAGAPLALDGYAWGASGYVFNAQGTQHVNYLGQDFHIHELWWDNNGWHHNDLTNAAGADPADENAYPIGYVFAAQNTQHINYLGPGEDPHIIELWWDSNGWHHNDLTIASGAPAVSGEDCNPVGYAFDAQGTQHVFYRDSNFHVTQLYWAP